MKLWKTVQILLMEQQQSLHQPTAAGSEGRGSSSPEESELHDELNDLAGGGGFIQVRTAEKYREHWGHDAEEHNTLGHMELNSKSSFQVRTWCASTHTSHSSVTGCKCNNGKLVTVLVFMFSTQDKHLNFHHGSSQNCFSGRTKAHGGWGSTCNVCRWFQRKYCGFTKHKPAFPDYWVLLDLGTTWQEYFPAAVISPYTS